MDDYGYALYNVSKGQFLKPLGTQASATFRSKQEMLEFAVKQIVKENNALSKDNFSHMRVVEVSLNAELDDKLVEAVDQVDEGTTDPDINRVIEEEAL